MPRKQPSRVSGRARRQQTSLLRTGDAEFFGRLADRLGIGLVIMDPQGIVRYGNEALTTILGTQNAWAVKPLQDYIASSSRQEFELALRRAKSGHAQGTFEVLSHGEILRTFQVSLSSFGDAIWMLIHDVSELLSKGKALRESEDSLHLLSSRLMKAQDMERRRMARDLHDITGQELAVILMSLTQLSKGVGKPDYDAGAAVAETSALVRKVENEIRTLSYILHPPMLDDLGLSSALSWYVDGFAKRSNIRLRLKIPEALPRLSRDKEIAVFRVVQESLANVLRHSGSTKAEIRAETKDGNLVVYVKDFGQGLSTAGAKPAGREKMHAGVGILGMRERLQEVGGTLGVASTSVGTEVCASVPLEEAPDTVSTETLASEIPATIPQSEDNAPSAEGNKSLQRRRILIADDHELMRRGIQALLATESDLEICGEAMDGMEAVAKAVQLHPDLVILDLIMPKLGGFSAAQRIHQRLPATKILVFTNHSYDQVQTLVRTVGCDGYVSKARAGTDLIRGIREVLGGRKFYDAEFSQTASA